MSAPVRNPHRRPAYRRHVEYRVTAVSLATGAELEVAAFPTRRQALDVQQRIGHDQQGHVTVWVGRIDRVSQ